MMSKLPLMLVSLVFAVSLGLAVPATADTFDTCKTKAGQSRYDVEAECYNEYGPLSDRWSAGDHSALDQCLAHGGGQFSTDVNECRDMYLAAGDPRLPYENRESAVSAAVGLALGLFVLFSM